MGDVLAFVHGHVQIVWQPVDQVLAQVHTCLVRFLVDSDVVYAVASVGHKIPNSVRGVAFDELESTVMRVLDWIIESQERAQPRKGRQRGSPQQFREGIRSIPRLGLVKNLSYLQSLLAW